ncbi:MAG TPA: hypothetical protein VHS30_08235 [Streptosporangiaceae bacterium]|nr:hypothetical protein [Streptosporangiaceae bacterium]
MTAPRARPRWRDRATQVGTAAAAWIALPALAGGWRVLHRPVDV